MFRKDKAGPVVRARRARSGRCCPAGPFMLNSLRQCPSGRGAGAEGGRCQARTCASWTRRPQRQGPVFVQQSEQGLDCGRVQSVFKEPAAGAQDGSSRHEQEPEGCSGVSLGKAQVRSCFSPSEGGPEGCEPSSHLRKTVI